MGCVKNPRQTVVIRVDYSRGRVKSTNSDDTECTIKSYRIVVKRNSFSDAPDNFSVPAATYNTTVVSHAVIGQVDGV